MENKLTGGTEGIPTRYTDQDNTIPSHFSYISSQSSQNDLPIKSTPSIYILPPNDFENVEVEIPPSVQSTVLPNLMKNNIDDSSVNDRQG